MICAITCIYWHVKKPSDAIAIDPLDHAKCLKVADELGWTIKTVANTHHHHDHIGGNDK